MITFDEAYETVIAAAAKLPSERVALAESLGRVLAADAVSDMNMPPFDTSAMDGYACRRQDIDGPLTEIEIIAAGHVPEKTVGPGQCSRIMTGAMVPPGADTVVMFEHTQIRDGRIHVVRKSDRANIRAKAEDIKAGDVVLQAGTTLGPVEIAVLAGAGCDPVCVSRVPVVAVIATGDELVEPADKPAPGQIRNSNSYQLSAQVRRAGCIARYFGIAADTPEAVDAVLRSALDQCDVVLFSGGVSVGDFDFVPRILKKNDVDLKFEKVAVKPGRPTVFGVASGKYFFGLPGNPVSTFVLFEVLVRPFLMKLMGCDYSPIRVAARLSAPITRKKTDRAEFRPVRLEPDATAGVFEYHGSGHIHAYSRANAVVSLPTGVDRLEAGSTITVRLI